MTVIAALSRFVAEEKDTGTVVRHACMAADTSTLCGCSVTPFMQKVFQLSSDVAVGFSGAVVSARAFRREVFSDSFLQKLARARKSVKVDIHESVNPLGEALCAEIESSACRSIRAKSKEWGYFADADCAGDPPIHSPNHTLIIAYGLVFSIDRQLCVVHHLNPAAIGAGADFALGAMWHACHRNVYEAHEVVVRAVECAQELTNVCGQINSGIDVVESRLYGDEPKRSRKKSKR